MFRRPTKDQIFVLIGIFAAILFTIGYGVIGFMYFDFTIPVIYTAEDRISFTLQWLTLPILTLLYGVFTASQTRFFDPNAIHGANAKQDSYLDKLLRYNQNTVEQLVLFAFAILHFSLIVPKIFLGLIPGACILFCIGRFAFHLGYIKYSPLRAFGFAVTFFPTLTMLSHNIMMMFFPPEL